MGNCVGTIVGEKKISYVSSIICFSWIEGFEATVVVVVFCTSFEQIVKRMNFLVWEITLQCFFGGAAVRTTSGIL
jgi:hypothetical protein